MTTRLIPLVCLAAILLSSIGAAQRGQRSRRPSRPDPGALKVGQYAPTFTLKSIDGKDTFPLREHRDKKPVVLLFGSYT